MFKVAAVVVDAMWAVSAWIVIRTSSLSDGRLPFSLRQEIRLRLPNPNAIAWWLPLQFLLLFSVTNNRAVESKRFLRSVKAFALMRNEQRTRRHASKKHLAAY